MKNLKKNQEKVFNETKKILAEIEAWDILHALNMGQLDYVDFNMLYHIYERIMRNWYDLYICEWSEWCGACKTKTLNDFINNIADDVYIQDICEYDLDEWENIDGKCEEAHAILCLQEAFGEFDYSKLNIVEQILKDIYEGENYDIKD